MSSANNTGSDSGVTTCDNTQQYGVADGTKSKVLKE